MPPFKECRICGTRWADRSLFLSDPDVHLAGYQVHFKELTTGLILFNHACRATLAIPASEFTDLHEGPVFTERATGSESCPGYCLRQEDLRPCPVRSGASALFSGRSCSASGSGPKKRARSNHDCPAI